MQISPEVYSFVNSTVASHMEYLLVVLIISASVIFYRILLRIKTPQLSPLEIELNEFRKKQQYTRVMLVSGLLYHEYQEALSEGFITHIAHFRLHREETFPDDPYAVSVYCGRFKIGFLPERYAEEVAQELDAGQTIRISLNGYYPHKVIFEQLEVKLINETRKATLALSA